MSVWDEFETVGATVPERLSERLARLIEGGRISAGSKLPSERHLTELLGASRISVRQALQDLEMRGYLSSRPRSGWVVNSAEERTLEGSIFGNLTQKQRSIREVMDLRSVIEPPISERAAVRHAHRELALLEQPLFAAEQELLKPAPSSLILKQCDVEFHSAIAQVTHNPLLVRLVQDTHEWMVPTRQAAFQTAERIRQSVSAHRVIFAAIQSRDPAAARNAMQEHLRSVLSAIDPLTER
ncbi:GntR family transcriptional repressor for pyruvate dehydrogenase complex [Arthrobacter woluwensis]|uniref:FadR/GntR family transcriptional regulator n=1 Tax=Arthrobacter woluwensis TaxID=156980 RepID=UPI00277E1C4E|nr:FadR/GntR family transcriptional regulator [Arthrobacter woluwensis]MDQ0707615.1 GntR family transcriptional repressor for pyruvate dehydrogenase complex [Arthrobacter woluwensis]